MKDLRRRLFHITDYPAYQRKRYLDSINSPEKICAVTDCPNPRHGKGRYCLDHKIKAINHELAVA